MRVNLVGVPSLVHSLTEILHDPVNRGVFHVTARDPRVCVEFEPVHTQAVVLCGVRSKLSDLVMDHLAQLSPDPFIVDRKRRSADLTVGVPASVSPAVVETAIYRALLDLRSRNGAAALVASKIGRRWWWPFLLLFAGVAEPAPAPITYMLNPGATSARFHMPLLFQPAPGGLIPLLVKISDGTDAALVSGSGSLQVTCDNCGAPPTFADNSAFTFGTTGTGNVGFVVDDTATNTVSENSAAAPRMSASRVVYFNQTNQGGTVFATIRDLAANDSLNVAIVDGSGNQITTFGGGAQYTEADTDTTITGTAVMWEDTSDTLRAASAANPLPVNVVAGGAGGGAIQDGVTSSIEATVFDYTNSNPVSVRLTDTSGDYVGAGGGTQYDEDTASTDAEKLTMAGVIRQDTPAGTTSLDGDRTPMKSDSVGRVWVNPSGVTSPISAASLPLPAGAATAANQLPDGHNVTVDNAAGAAAVNIQDGGNVITVDGTVTATGAAADGAAVSGNPVRIGGKDGSGNTQDVATDTAGELQVDVLTMPTVTVTDGGGAMNVIVDSGTTVVTQATATNLNAAVVGTGTAGSPAGNILTVQGVASMTKLLVTPDSVALPANQSVNLAQVAGTTIVFACIARIAGVEWPMALVIGGAISMSSTAIIMHQLTDRAESPPQVANTSTATPESPSPRRHTTVSMKAFTGSLMPGATGRYSSSTVDLSME